MSQAEAAEALGVSRSALNAWENDRAWPRNSVGALEQLYGISLGGEPPAALDEALIAALYADIKAKYPEAVADRMIRQVDAGLRGEPPPGNGPAAELRAGPAAGR